MKRIIKSLILCMIIIVSITGCSKDKETRIDEVNIDTLNDVNNKIIAFFNSKSEDEYKNFSCNYVDEKNKVVIVGLINNSEEEQEWFRNNVIDSPYIKFEQHDRASTGNVYKDYEKVSSLKCDIDTSKLVRYNGDLYVVSNRNAVIDLIVPDDEPVGTITKLIPKEYVPKYDWETNSSDLLNSKVYSHDGEEPIIIYNGSNLLLLFDRVK